MRFSKLPTRSQCGSLAILFLAVALVFTACNKPSKTGSDVQPIKVGGKEVYTDSSNSSVKVFDQNGRVCIQQTNTSYEVANVYDAGKKIPLLLKIKKTDLCYADSTNKQKVFEITAKSVMDTKPMAWEAKFTGTNMQFKDNTILVMEEGQEDEDDYLQRFSLTDGKEVFNCSRGEMMVGIPNVKDKRFIGYTSLKTASQPLQALNEENLIGIIHYSNPAGAGAAIKIKLKRGKAAEKISRKAPDMVLVPSNENTTAIEDGKAIILMKANANYQPADVKDFAAKFTYYYGDDNESTDIIIPIANDKLDLAGAKFDKDIFEVVAAK